ncbi:hypothetical protein [Glutamicibacter sp. 2E12]|uniref:hypothetical protein n=1 Tax=Glutamicibacter sp. 2E12 TaxID=3416181 RepID=UPI003CEE86F2
MNTRAEVIDALVAKIKAGQTGNLDTLNQVYVTAGGTYVLASRGIWNDSGKPHDLVAIVPGLLGSGRVVPLDLSVNDDFVTALREAFDG